MVSIYAIENPSGSFYIGQSIKTKRRFTRYRAMDCKSQVGLYNSFKKYGVNNHKFSILHLLPYDIDRKVLDNYELFYYTIYKSAGFKMLNIKQAFGRGGEIADSTKEKIRQANFSRTYKPHTDEAKLKMSLALKGRKTGPPSQETRDKISKAQIGKKKPAMKEEIKERFKILFKGRKMPLVGNIKLSKIRSIAIVQYDLSGNIIKEWPSSKVACETLKLSRSRMTNVLKGANNNIYKKHKWVVL